MSNDDKGIKAGLRILKSAELPDLAIYVLCSVCNHAWQITVAQPVEKLNPRTCVACKAWGEVMGVIDRIGRYTHKIERDADIAGELLDVVVKYVEAIPPREVR